MKATNKNPLVSIIINCHNGERYLQDCLLSVINQTYQNWEIIFWDNKSNDRSKKIFKSFKDERLKYFFSKKFTNLYEARNLALKKVSGSIIMFIDVDDKWLPNKIDEQVKIFIKKKNINIICTNYYRQKNFIINYRKKFLNVKRDCIYNYEDLIKSYNVGLSTIAIKKKILNNYKKKIFNEKLFMISDFELMINLSLKYEIYFICIPLVIYRQHPQQQSRKNFITQLNHFTYWYKKKVYNSKIFSSNNLNFLHKKYIFCKLLLKTKKAKSFFEILSILYEINENRTKLKILLYYFFPKIFISYIIST